MPDHLQLDDHRPRQPITVRRHPIDWDDDQFDIMTAQRAMGWDQRLSRGCWYLNPRYTVHAPSPSASFFKKVREVQGSWLRTVRQAIHNRGLRRESRQRDHFGRQLAFSGVLFFDGDIIPPNTWNRLADKLIKPFEFHIVETHRHLDLAVLEATANFDQLKQSAQSALQAHLDEHPADAAFILPNLTMTSPVITPAFHQKVEQATKQWSQLLKRTLGKVGFRDALKVADAETEALVFGGVIYANGGLQWPYCGTNHSHVRSVPERLLNLFLTIPQNPCGITSTQPNLAPASTKDPSILAPKFSSTEPSAVNEEFKVLFA